MKSRLMIISVVVPSGLVRFGYRFCDEKNSTGLLAVDQLGFPCPDGSLPILRRPSICSGRWVGSFRIAQATVSFMSAWGGVASFFVLVYFLCSVPGAELNSRATYGAIRQPGTSQEGSISEQGFSSQKVLYFRRSTAPGSTPLDLPNAPWFRLSL